MGKRMAALLLTLLMVAGATARAEEKATLKVAQMGTSIKSAMVVLAQETGLFAEEGLDVRFEQIANLNDGMTALILGKLDVLPYGVIPSCTFVAQGAEAVIFGGTIAEGCQAVVKPENAEKYADLHNLAGATIACVRPETGHMMMKARLREMGVEASFVEMDGFQSVVEAVLKGSAEIGFVNSGFGQNAVAQGLAILFDVGDYAPNAVCCRQTTSATAIEEKREALVAFEVALLRAYERYRTEPDEVVATLAAFSGQSEEYVHNCLYDGVMIVTLDPARHRVVDFYEVMRANGDIAADAPSIEDHVDADIYRDALNEMLTREPDSAVFQELSAAYATNND